MKKLIYGKRGTGKSYALLKEVEKTLKNNPQTKAVIITSCPDAITNKLTLDEFKFILTSNRVFVMTAKHFVEHNWATEAFTKIFVDEATDVLNKYLHLGSDCTMTVNIDKPFLGSAVHLYRDGQRRYVAEEEKE